MIGGLAVMLALTTGAVEVPREARAVNTSRPDRWVGDGTPGSCTWRAVVRAVARGGVIRRRRDLLRQQRPHRRARDPLVDAATESE